MGYKVIHPNGREFTRDEWHDWIYAYEHYSADTYIGMLGDTALLESPMGFCYGMDEMLLVYEPDD